VRWYLAAPLSKDELITLLKKLGIPPSGLVRKSEPIYTEQYEGKNISEEEWLDILAANPILVQRPVVEKEDKAIIARPPEQVLSFLGI
jgi:arsenate reductase